MSAQERVNILIVDDQKANLLALETVLKGLSLNIVKASSGNEALAHLLETEFACLVLDVKMPEMDGFELAKIIRTDERTKYVPIIFASAQQEQSDVFKGYETGAVDYLFKPLDPTVVRSKIGVFAELYKKGKALGEYAEELKRSNAELDQYASVVAHDLQAPLRRVVSCAEILDRQYREKLGPDADKWLKMMTENAKRMHTLVGDLLTYSKVGREQTVEKVELKKVIGDVLEDLSLAIEESGAKINYQKIPPVTVNAIELRHLLQNLIGNAIKYRKREHPPEVDISAEKQETQWLLKVKDNGIGFDPCHREKLFVLFGRLHSAREYPGTGIGLAICRKIVERRGGKIWADSEPGKGSTFQFTLPGKF